MSPYARDPGLIRGVGVATSNAVVSRGRIGICCPILHKPCSSISRIRTIEPYQLVYRCLRKGYFVYPRALVSRNPDEP
jgi:hypothetical protein